MPSAVFAKSRTVAGSPLMSTSGSEMPSFIVALLDQSGRSNANFAQGRGWLRAKRGTQQSCHECLRLLVGSFQAQAASSTPARASCARQFCCNGTAQRRRAAHGIRGLLPQRAIRRFHRVEALVPVALLVLLLRGFQRFLQLILNLFRVLLLQLGLDHRDALLTVPLAVGPRPSGKEQQCGEDRDRQQIAHGIYTSCVVGRKRCSFPLPIPFWEAGRGSSGRLSADRHLE